MGPILTTLKGGAFECPAVDANRQEAKPWRENAKQNPGSKGTMMKLRNGTLLGILLMFVSTGLFAQGALVRKNIAEGSIDHGNGVTNGRDAKIAA